MLDFLKFSITKNKNDGEESWEKIGENTNDPKIISTDMIRPIVNIRRSKRISVEVNVILMKDDLYENWWNVKSFKKN